MNKQKSKTRERVEDHLAMLVLLSDKANYLWYSQVAMELKLVETRNVQTFATDGTHIFFNPDFVDTQSDGELLFDICHEIEHNTYKHPFRKGSRDHRFWNYAGDYVINLGLEEQGMDRPDIVLYDERFRGLCTEEVYDILIEEAEQKQKRKGDGNGGGGKGDDDTDGDDHDISCRCVLPPPSKVYDDDGTPNEYNPDDHFMPSSDDDSGQEEHPKSEMDWDVIIKRVSETCGHRTPSHVQRLIAANTETRTRWEEQLRKYVKSKCKRVSTWSRPNRRHAHSGLYLPGKIPGPTCPDILVLSDVSGSISDDHFRVMANELHSIMKQLQPKSLTVVYWDDMVHSSQVFTPHSPKIILKTPGGGGTCLQPALDWIAASDNPNPKICIIFTDAHIYDHPKKPNYPVLWCLPKRHHGQVPFEGDIIEVDVY